jgi:hypothetical protein
MRETSRKALKYFEAILRTRVESGGSLQQALPAGLSPLCAAAGFRSSLGPGPPGGWQKWSRQGVQWRPSE